MADFWTHYYCGKKLINANKNLINNEKIFYLGCQGPDIFFYKKFAVHTTPKNLGELIHENKINEVFKEIFIYLKNKPSEQLKNYVFGWILHYVLDKNIHPYINQNSEWSHKRLEANIDTYIIDKYLKKTIFEMSSKEILAVTEEHNIIICLYQRIAKNVFDMSLSKKDYIKSINNFSIFHRVFNQKNNIKRSLILLIGKLIGKNLSIFFYHGPGEIKLPKDIIEVDLIIEKSTVEASIIIQELIKYLNGYISLEDLFNNFEGLNYSGEIPNSK